MTLDGTTKSVSRNQILRHERGQGKLIFCCPADHEQDWQLYAIDPYSVESADHTYKPFGGISRCGSSNIIKVPQYVAHTQVQTFAASESRASGILGLMGTGGSRGDRLYASMGRGLEVH